MLEIDSTTLGVNLSCCSSDIDFRMERNHIEDISYFVAFCVEIYKNAHAISGVEASEVFSAHGVMEYLSDNFEVLHTQSPSWILAEIDDIIASSK